MGGLLRVACCQVAPVVGDLTGNLVAAQHAVRATAARGASVIVLPELVTSGYCFESPQEARSVALTTDSDELAELADAAPESVLVLGYAELGGDGQLYNSAVVFDRGHLVAEYRKVHLWDREQLVFRSGSAPPPVCDTSAGRIGVLVCYDLEFPEMTRSIALRGAELLAVPTNWPWVDRPEGAEAPEVVIAMAAARVNRMAIACCDRSGTERGQAWTEASAVSGPDGWIRARVDSTGCAVADLDPADSRLKRISARNDVLADRRPDVYACEPGYPPTGG